eukprot:1580992-Rhodomonas_salina.6
MLGIGAARTGSGAAQCTFLPPPIAPAPAPAPHPPAPGSLCKDGSAARAQLTKRHTRRRGATDEKQGPDLDGDARIVELDAPERSPALGARAAEVGHVRGQPRDDRCVVLRRRILRPQVRSDARPLPQIRAPCPRYARSAMDKRVVMLQRGAEQRCEFREKRQEIKRRTCLFAAIRPPPQAQRRVRAGHAAAPRSLSSNSSCCGSCEQLSASALPPLCARHDVTRQFESSELFCSKAHASDAHHRNAPSNYAIKQQRRKTKHTIDLHRSDNSFCHMIESRSGTAASNPKVELHR